MQHVWNVSVCWEGCNQILFKGQSQNFQNRRPLSYFSGGSDGKASAPSAGDLGSIPGSARSPGEGNGNPLQYYCLENPMDRGAWWATVHGVTKSQTRLSDFTSVIQWKFKPRFEACALTAFFSCLYHPFGD